MRQTRPPLVGRLLDRLPQPASPWRDTEHTEHTSTTDGHTRTRPIVLVHGTAGSRDNFEKIVPVLRGTGRPVLSVSYGHRGTRGLRDSLGEVVDQLAEITGRVGAVDLVGHSQGGLLALAATGFLEDRTSGDNDHNDDNTVVHHVVGLAADFRGVGRPWFRPPESRILHRIDQAFLPALADQLTGSPALDDVLRHTVHTDVPVTQIITRGDRIVPEARARALVTSDPLTGLPAHPGPVQVVTIQDRFPDARISHAVIPHHRVVGTLIAEALATNVTRPRNRDQTSVRRPQDP